MAAVACSSLCVTGRPLFAVVSVVSVTYYKYVDGLSLVGTQITKP